MKRDMFGIGSRISHSEFGDGVVTGINSMTYTVTFMKSGQEDIPKDDEKIVIIERIEPDHDHVSLYDVEQSLLSILKKWAGEPEVVHLGDRWKGGSIVLKPRDSGLQSKEIPIDMFFHKIILIRDRLRVLEQKINGSKGLEEDAKVELQQYITRIYGSLTTFNVLFKFKEDQFVGEKLKD